MCRQSLTIGSVDSTDIYVRKQYSHDGSVVTSHRRGLELDGRMYEEKDVWASCILCDKVITGPASQQTAQR